jgi:hypothetical protein
VPRRPSGSCWRHFGRRRDGDPSAVVVRGSGGNLGGAARRGGGPVRCVAASRSDAHAAGTGECYDLDEHHSNDHDVDLCRRARPFASGDCRPRSAAAGRPLHKPASNTGQHYNATAVTANDGCPRSVPAATDAAHDATRSGAVRNGARPDRGVPMSAFILLAFALWIAAALVAYLGGHQGWAWIMLVLGAFAALALADEAE